MDMADATGGLAITNTNAVERPLQRVARDFENYYSLGFPAEHGRTGRYYKLEVKVKRPGVRVRHRAGYRDQTRERLIEDGSLAGITMLLLRQQRGDAGRRALAGA